MPILIVHHSCKVAGMQTSCVWAAVFHFSVSYIDKKNELNAKCS